jgi:hypothetical protein
VLNERKNNCHDKNQVVCKSDNNTLSAKAVFVRNTQWTNIRFKKSINLEMVICTTSYESHTFFTNLQID